MAADAQKKHAQTKSQSEALATGIMRAQNYKKEHQ